MTTAYAPGAFLFRRAFFALKGRNITVALASQGVSPWEASATNNCFRPEGAEQGGELTLVPPFQGGVLRVIGTTQGETPWALLLRPVRANAITGIDPVGAALAESSYTAAVAEASISNVPAAQRTAVRFVRPRSPLLVSSRSGSKRSRSPST